MKISIRLVMNLEYWFIKTWWQQAAECRWERFRNFSFVCCNFWFIFLFIIFIFCNLIGSSPSADEQGFNSVCFISFLCIRCFVFNFFFFFCKPSYQLAWGFAFSATLRFLNTNPIQTHFKLFDCWVNFFFLTFCINSLTPTVTVKIKFKI